MDPSFQASEKSKLGLYPSLHLLGPGAKGYQAKVSSWSNSALPALPEGREGEVLSGSAL